jgi:SAM-dependent methyltransferase
MKHKQDPEDYWEQPEQVKRFAEREPDKRLLSLLLSFPQPGHVRVLDIGCAGGRNAVVLAENGFDFFAVDASFAMIQKTRERIASILGGTEARKRAKVFFMSDLSVFSSESFQLIVALGSLHNARSREEWQKTLSETSRLLQPGGQLLMSNFSPQSNPHGQNVQPVSGKPHVFQGFSSGRLYLLEANELDTEMAHFGFQPLATTETVRTKTENGYRVTVNGHYRKTN